MAERAMNEIYTSLSIALILSWIVYTPIRFFRPAKQAAGIGVLLGAMIIVAARETQPIMIFASLLGPASLGLSFLILRALAKPFIPVRNLPVREQVFVLFLLVFYNCASAGVIFFDPYRLGFDPVIAGCVAATLCLYCGIRGYTGFMLLPVCAQITWVLGLGSSNYFDHLFNALMMPVLMVSITTAGFKKRSEKSEHQNLH